MVTVWEQFDKLIKLSKIASRIVATVSIWRRDVIQAETTGLEKMQLN